MRIHALALALLASLCMVFAGCSNTEDFVFSNFNNGGTNTLSREQESVFTAFTQDSVARLVGRTVELAPLISPVNTTPREVRAQSILGAAREPGAVIPLEGDFTLRSSLFAGRVRIEIFRGNRRFAVADLLPAVRTATGFDQTVILGPERSSSVENISGGRISTTIYEQLFFGYTGQALLKYDQLGKLVSVTYQDVVVPGTTFATTPNYKQFLPINGTLTRSGNELNGTLSYGDSGDSDGGDFTIRELISATESHQTLLMASNLFGGQGRAFLSANFDAEGVYSPIPDPSLSSPLVNVDLSSLTGIDNSAVTSSAVSYTVRDGIFQAVLPGGSVQGADIVAIETFVGLAPGASIPIPSDATLQMFLNPEGSLAVGDKAQVFVYAVGSNGKAVPFAISGFGLNSGDSNVVRVTTAGSNQIEAVGAGTTILVFRDNASNKTASVNVTVRSSQTAVNGFVYLADFGDQSIVSYDFSSQTGVPGTRVETPIGHSPFQLLISSDRTRLISENSDQTVQVFDINPDTGALTEITEQSLNLRGLAQSQLDPGIYYGVLNSEVVELEYSDNLGFQATRVLTTNSGTLQTALVNGSQIVFGSRLNEIYSIDAASGNNRVVTMEAGAAVTEMAVTRLGATGPQTLEVLVRRDLGGGNFDSVLRSFQINNDGTLNTPGSRQRNVDADARALAVSGDRAYNGSFVNTVINGSLIALSGVTALPNEPYQTAGAATALAVTGLNDGVLMSASSTALRVFQINTDGSLTGGGTVDNVGTNVTDMKALTI